MSGHTKEPWAYGGTAVADKADLIRIFSNSVDAHVGEVGQYFSEVYTEDGKRIAFIAGPTSPDNAHRIVVCVNACAGISNDVLEAGAIVESDKLYAADKALEAAIDQRDELLKAMKKLSGMKLNMIADGIIDKAIAEAEAQS